MVQAANSIEMLARRNCASILLAYESTALDKPSTVASGDSRSYLSPFERLYKCKDCDRTFVSFQALGGHRASHMKIRLPRHPYSETVDTPDGGDDKGVVAMAVARPVRMKVHKCRQCQDRFPTGQALGGHMRKHADLSVKRKQRSEEGFENSLEGSEKCDETFRVESDKKRQRVVLQLDLNCPPPVDEPLLPLV